MGYLRFIDVLRVQGDPDATVTVKKPDGTHISVAPLSTLLDQWDEREAELARLKEEVQLWQQVAAKYGVGGVVE